jgi:hypothetical protein
VALAVGGNVAVLDLVGVDVLGGGEGGREGGREGGVSVMFI